MYRQPSPPSPPRREVQGQLVQCCVRRLVDVYWRHLAAPGDVTAPTSQTDDVTTPPAPSQHQALQALVDVHLLKTLASARDQVGRVQLWGGGVKVVCCVLPGRLEVLNETEVDRCMFGRQ